jgi:ABC-type Fe3+/spermidine/putrescine transport system ATPase subunit
VLRDGRIIQQAPPPELYAHPVDVRLASFIGAANLIDGVLEPGRELDQANSFVRTPLGRLPACWSGDTRASPSSVTALVRPEQITVASPSNGTGIAGRVLSRGFHGHDTVLSIELVEGAAAGPLLVRALGSPPLMPGDRCRLTASGTTLVWARDVDRPA